MIQGGFIHDQPIHLSTRAYFHLPDPGREGEGREGRRTKYPSRHIAALRGCWPIHFFFHVRARTLLSFDINGKEHAIHKHMISG